MLFVNNGFLARRLMKKEEVALENLNFEFSKKGYMLRLMVMHILVVWVFIKKKTLKMFSRNPKVNTYWVDGFSELTNAIKEGAQSWKALDIIYNYRFREEGGMHNKWEDWWLRIANARAVRNRLKLVSHLLEAEILRIAREQGKTEVKVFSIASGSAQAVLSAALTVKKHGIKTKITLLDLDQEALEYSKNLSKKYGLNGDIVTIQSATNGFEKKVESPDIIEMVGFLDYRPHAKAVKLLKRIKEFLPSYGSFITANIMHNPEKWFMHIVLNWPMLHRKRNEFEKVLEEADFASFQTVVEPYNIHVVGVCYKKN